jgi:hypothetical protein
MSDVATTKNRRHVVKRRSRGSFHYRRGCHRWYNKTVEPLLVVDGVFRRSIFSARAYRLYFTDRGIYFIHLGEDSGQIPLGPGGGLAGALARAIADKLSEAQIGKNLQRLEQQGLDRAVACDKRSSRALYGMLEAFHSQSYTWYRWPHVTFQALGKAPLKLTFDIGEEDHGEAKRRAIIDLIKEKRPDLVPP